MKLNNIPSIIWHSNNCIFINKKHQCDHYLSCFSFVAASILHDLPDSQQTLNNVKIEHPGYYCNSYADPEPVSAVGTDRSSSVEAMVVSSAYCMKNKIIYKYIFSAHFNI